MKTNVIINTRFEAIHCWPECPIPEVSFLRTPHRHEFWVEVKLRVSHSDRDVEFIQFKRILDRYLDQFRGGDMKSTSCEMLAQLIGDWFRGFLYDVVYVRVMEDGENGAEVIYE